jgi:hypothetical protein
MEATSFERVFDVRRGHRLAVVKLHSRPKVERMGKSVGALLETAGETGNHRQILVDRDNGIVNIL